MSNESKQGIFIWVLNLAVVVLAYCAFAIWSR